jgi:hypothetical protein
MLTTWKSRILELLATSPGLTDREITDRLAGRGRGQQLINQMCRQLENEGRLTRRPRHDGLIRNYLRIAERQTDTTNVPVEVGHPAVGLGEAEHRSPPQPQTTPAPSPTIRSPSPGASPIPVPTDGWLSEDDLKQHLGAWLENLSWSVQVAWLGTAGGFADPRQDAFSLSDPRLTRHDQAEPILDQRAKGPAFRRSLALRAIEKLLGEAHGGSPCHMSRHIFMISICQRPAAIDRIRSVRKHFPRGTGCGGGLIFALPTSSRPAERKMGGAFPALGSRGFSSWCGRRGGSRRSTASSHAIWRRPPRSGAGRRAAAAP